MSGNIQLIPIRPAHEDTLAKDQDLVSEAIKNCPNKLLHAKIYRSFGKVYLSADHTTAASWCFETAIKTSTKIEQVKCHRLWALALEKEERYDQAKEAYARALALAQECPGTVKLQVKIVEAQKRTEMLLANNSAHLFTSKKLLELARLLYQQSEIALDLDNIRKLCEDAQEYCSLGMLKTEDIHLKLPLQFLRASIFFKLALIETNSDAKLKLFHYASNHCNTALSAYASSKDFAPLAGRLITDVQSDYNLAFEELQLCDRTAANLKNDHFPHSIAEIKQAEKNVNEAHKKARLALQRIEAIHIRGEVVALQGRVKKAMADYIKEQQGELLEEARKELSHAKTNWKHANEVKTAAQKLNKLHYCLNHCKIGINSAPKLLNFPELLELYYYGALSHQKMGEIQNDSRSKMFHYQKADNWCVMGLKIADSFATDPSTVNIDTQTFRSLIEHIRTKLALFLNAEAASQYPQPQPPVFSPQPVYPIPHWVQPNGH